jgi:hypothetical protein
MRQISLCFPLTMLIFLCENLNKTSENYSVPSKMVTLKANSVENICSLLVNRMQDGVAFRHRNSAFLRMLKTLCLLLLLLLLLLQLGFHPVAVVLH